MKKGKEAYVEPVIEAGGYRFTVKTGQTVVSEADVPEEPASLKLVSLEPRTSRTQARTEGPPPEARQTAKRAGRPCPEGTC